MAYPSKPIGNNILPFDTIFADNNSNKISMTTAEILDGYNNDGENETELTSVPDANRFNMFWYQTHNTIKWIVDYIEELYNAKLEKSGGTMTGILDMGANKVKTTYKPQNAEDLTNKAYVDKIINSAMWIGEVKTMAYPYTPSLPEGMEVVPCDGRAISRSTYSELYSLIGTSFGAGDGVNTFNIPDYRGLFLRGWDGNSNRDKDRVFGQIQQAGLPNHDHIFNGTTAVNNVSHSHTRGTMNITGVFDVTNNWPTRAYGDGTPSPRGTGAFSVINRWGTNAAGNGGTGAVGVDFQFNAANSWTGETSAQNVNHTHAYNGTTTKVNQAMYQDNLTEVRPINSTCYYLIRIK